MLQRPTPVGSAQFRHLAEVFEPTGSSLGNCLDQARLPGPAGASGISSPRPAGRDPGVRSSSAEPRLTARTPRRPCRLRLGAGHISARRFVLGQVGAWPGRFISTIWTKAQRVIEHPAGISPRMAVKSTTARSPFAKLSQHRADIPAVCWRQRYQRQPPLGRSAAASRRQGSAAMGQLRQYQHRDARAARSRVIH